MNKMLPLCAALFLVLTACTKKEETTNVIQQTTSGGGTTKKRVFVTLDTYTGNLMAEVPGAANGPAAADAICTSAASRAGLGGSWVAWITASGNSAFNRLNDVGPWYLPNETTVVFTSKSRILNSVGGSNASINMTEYGTTYGGSQEVWTGTLPNGVVSSTITYCGGWASTTGSTFIGDTAQPVNFYTWTNSATVNPCGASRRLYCFEQ